MKHSAATNQMVIHDDMTDKVIRDQGQGQEMTSIPLGTIFAICCHSNAQLRNRKTNIILIHTIPATVLPTVEIW